MSDTNRVDLRVKEESPAGTLATGSYEACPFTAASDLGLTPEYIPSAEIRADRQVGERKLVGQSVGGGFDFELQAGDNLSYPLNLLLQGALQTDSIVTPAGDGSKTVVDDLTSNGSVISSAGVDLTTIVGIGEKAVIVIENTLNGAGDGVYDLPAGPVAGVWNASGTIPSFTATATTSVTPLVTFRNGVTEKSFSLEKSYTDQTTPLYEYLSGLRVDTLSLNFATKSIATGSVGFVGTGHEYTTSRVASGTGVHSGDGVFSSANFGTVREGSTGFGIGGTNFVTALSMDISNNLRERVALGSAAPVSIGTGQFNVGGSMKMYFDNKDAAEKVLNTSSTFTLSWHVDCSSSIWAFVLPNVKFTQGTPSVSGANDDVMLDLNWEAAGTNHGTLAVGTSLYS